MELEQRFGLRHLRLSQTQLVIRHLIAPCAVLAVLGLLGAGALVVLGVMPPAALPGATAVVVVAGPLLVGCAALVATGPALAPGLLYLGEVGAALVLVHLVRGPQLAVAVVGVPTLVAVAALRAGAALPLLVFGAGLWALAAAALLARAVCRRATAYH